MTEAEASELWCPHINRLCITKKCMMWDQSPITTWSDRKADSPGDGWVRNMSFGPPWHWSFNAAGHCKIRQAGSRL